MDGATLKDIQVNQFSTKYSTQQNRLFQVYLYDISIDDDRDPLARVLFKYPPDLGEDMVGLVSFSSNYIFPPDPSSVRPHSCCGRFLQRHLRGAQLHQDEVQEHPHLQPRGHPSDGG